ncbi:hypothetical protein ScPMuIL_011095 [Solemya velum]
MGRTILVEDGVQGYVDRLSNTGQWHLGLIIGQLTSQRDYGVQLIRTPEPAEDEVSEEEEDEILNTPKRKRRRSSHKPDSLENIDEQWVATHAKQVTRMLPGGLDVIGIFALAKPQMLTRSQAKLRQILFSIRKIHDKGQIVHDEDAVADRYLLQICSATRKLTCRTIDVSDPKSTFRPGEWKCQTSPEPWIELRCQITTDLKITVPLGAQNHSLLKQILGGLRPYCHTLWNALATVNGEMRPEADSLDQSSGGRKTRSGKDRGTSQQQCYTISLFSQSTNNKHEVSICDKSARIWLRGQTHSRAYVPGRSSVGDAVKALKTDVIRSLVSRCELLCEDIEVVDEVKDKNLYDSPIRVFGQLPGSTVNFCDYMFQDEKIDEVLERIQELLDVTITEDDLQRDCERVATQDDWPKPKPKPKVEPGADTPVTAMTAVRVYLGAFLGGMAAVLAGVSYMYMGDS